MGGVGYRASNVGLDCIRWSSAKFTLRHGPYLLPRTWPLATAKRAAQPKVRTGGPIDDAEDMTRPVWAGVVPLRLASGAPEPAPELTPGMALPVTAWPLP